MHPDYSPDRDTPENMLEGFSHLPLPQRMLAAGTVLAAATERAGGGPMWDSFGLRAYAARWEAEDRAKAEQDAMVEELAKWLSINIGNWPLDEWHLRLKPDYWHDRARELMGAGWRKGSSDE